MNWARETSACSRCVTYLAHDREYSPRYSPRIRRDPPAMRMARDARGSNRMQLRGAWMPYGSRTEQRSRTVHIQYTAPPGSARQRGSARRHEPPPARSHRDTVEISPGRASAASATGTAPAAFYGKVNLSFSKIHLHLDEPGRRAGRRRGRVGGRILGRLEPLRHACTYSIARRRALTANPTFKRVLPAPESRMICWYVSRSSMRSGASEEDSSATGAAGRPSE